MWKIISAHPRLLLFGFIGAFFSGLGQTYLLSLFNPFLMTKLSLSRSELSSLYSFSTLVAAFFLPFIGRKIDQFPMRRVVFFLATFLAFSFLLLGNVNSFFQLTVVFIFVRALGQAALPMAISANISKRFGLYRGKALSIFSMGRSFSEGIFPLIFASLLIKQGFEKTTFFMFYIMMAIFIPVIFLLLKKNEMESYYPEKNKYNHQEQPFKKMNWSYFFRDHRLVLLSIANLTMPFLLTAIFFHHQLILKDKGWDLRFWGQGFVWYALSQMIANLFSGYAIDRFGARVVITTMLLPLLLSFMSLSFFNFDGSHYLFFIFSGITTGMNVNCRDAYFAEIFGPKHLGSIRGIDSMVVVIGTALAPIIFSMFFDLFSMQTFYYILMVHCLLGIFIYFYLYIEFEKRNR